MIDNDNPTSPEIDHSRVAPTAWGVSYLRTFSDIPLSIEVFDALSRRLAANGESDIALGAKRDHLAPQLEARYKLVDRLIVQKGTNQVIELAAGVATHGINLTRANPDLNYVELDLPGVVKEKEAILEDIGIELPPNFSVVEGDALKEKDVERALLGFSKAEPLTVVNEGLMRYLTFDQKAILAKTVHGLLSEYGGVWITPDISLRQALAREDEVASGQTQRLKQTTGIDIEKNVFEDVQHAKDFFESLGFNIEEHSFLEVTNELVSPATLGMSADEVQRLIEPCVVFVMTLKQ